MSILTVLHQPLGRVGQIGGSDLGYSCCSEMGWECAQCPAPDTKQTIKRAQLTAVIELIIKSSGMEIWPPSASACEGRTACTTHAQMHVCRTVCNG